MDWEVYHLVVANPGGDIASFSSRIGCTSEEVRAALHRLKSALLVEEMEGGHFRALSVQEMLIRCQARYDRNFPLSIEDGIIRLKDDREKGS